jgi:excisionase family DNA binding protein
MRPRDLPLPAPEDIDRLPVRTLPSFIVELAALQARAAIRLHEHAVSPEPGPSPEQLLTVHEAAARLGMSVDWLYRHKDKLPFAQRVGRRAVRFSKTGLDKWAAQRR